MRVCALSCVLLWCLSTPTMVFAQQDQDREGCRDSPLLTRLAGCYISSCSKADYDAAQLTIATSGDPRTKSIEGKIEQIRYVCQGKSALQVRRNAEQALKSAGYTLDFSGYDVPVHYVTSHKGPQWVAVEASEMTSDSNYTVITVLAEGMTQEMTANADAWAGEITKTGRVAIYGIEFDTGQATLKPESEAVLAEVLKLLKNQPDWKMRIEGHTDSTGTRASNQALSEKRAQAVVAWLTKNGVTAARLVAAGLGDTNPIADNKTEEGRARNRRVELVRP
jgi:OmpA-OmpF porin, OOP family